MNKIAKKNLNINDFPSPFISIMGGVYSQTKFNQITTKKIIVSNFHANITTNAYYRQKAIYKIVPHTKKKKIESLHLVTLIGLNHV